jgi:hypothetical protein
MLAIERRLGRVDHQSSSRTALSCRRGLAGAVEGG